MTFRRYTLFFVAVGVALLCSHYTDRSFQWPLDKLVVETIEQCRILLFGDEPKVVVVDLHADRKDHLFSWPMKRDALAKLGERILASGALSLGIEIDMSQLSEPGEDQELRRLLENEPRIVVLAFLEPNANLAEKLGYFFDAQGRIVGLSCPARATSDSAPFAIRVAAAAGILDDTVGSHCIDGVLSPASLSGNRAVSVMSLSDLNQHAAWSRLKNKVVIVGSADAGISVGTIDGASPPSLINANVIQSAADGRWRSKSRLLDAALIAVLAITVSTIALAISTRLQRGVVGVLLILGLLLLRAFVQFPLDPGLLIVFIGLVAIPKISS